MRIIIYGVGAVGGVVGAALALGGSEVLGIARGRQLAALQAGPLRLRSPNGDRSVDLPCVGHPSEIAFRTDDLILLTMKTQDTGSALLALRAAGVRDQAIFCLQNGIANEAMALRLFPNVHGVTVMMPAAYIEPGEVLGYGTPKLGIFDIGRYPSGRDTADATLARLFDSAEMAGFVHGDVMSSKRGKLLLNLGNALEGSLGRGNDRGDWPARVQAEAERVLRAAGHDWDDVGMDDPRRKDLMQMGEIAGVTRFGGSTSQSLLRGAGSVETDYLNGEIVRLARLYRVEAPLNTFLTDLMALIANEGHLPGAVTLEGLERLFTDWQAGRPLTIGG